MKFIYLTIFTSLLLFGIALTSHQVSAAVCQNKTAIVYSNGMFNTAEMANAALVDGLRVRLILTSPTFADSTKYEYQLAFASDGSQYTPPNIVNMHPISSLLDEAYIVANGAAQVTEVVLQRLLQEDVSSFWRWIAGMQDGGSRLQNIMNTLAAGTNSASYIYDPDLQNQVGLYKGLLNAGKKVVIVSHSQGNLYANASYSQLILTDPAWANSVGNVQVSSPASANLGAKLGGDEPQITVNEDIVMNFVQSINLGTTMPRKPDPLGGWSPNMQELGGSAARNAATYGHNFVKWYLAGTYTRSFILNGIVDTINGVNGVGGLQYPRQCVPWPPTQTPTSWQQFLTHDWTTVKVGNNHKRRIRDDVNELMFTADAYGLYPPLPTTNGTVRINVRSFDGSSTGSLTYQKRIPAGVLSSYFLGFVPVPNGVGSLWYNSTSHAYAIPPGYTSIRAHGWDTSVTLVSSQWNISTQTWSTSTVTKQLPAIIPMGTRGCRIVGWWQREQCSMDTLVNTSSYILPTYSPVQYAPNKSWLLFEGSISLNSRSSSIFPATGHWGVIEINNGQLIVGAAGSIPYSYSIPTADRSVAVPIGLYSPIHTALAGGNGLRLFSYNVQMGRPSLTGGYGPIMIPFRPVPAVPVYPNYKRGDFIVDQLIIGGSSMYTLGQGVRSAAGYYQLKVLAGVVKGQVSNAAGQVHPSKTVQDILNGAIIANPRDATFFQWQ